MPSANATGFRLHIGVFEGRDFGKSGLFNAIPHHKVLIVSEIDGTNSDPAEKPMDEEGAWGPDQEQQLAELRTHRIPVLVARERANL